jgi:hypothetical protein
MSHQLQHLGAGERADLLRRRHAVDAAAPRPDRHRGRREIAEATGVIEQAKGMLIYRITSDPAFELLRWRSQETKTKLRALAEQIVKDFLELRYDEDLPLRSAYDRVLLTVHNRV